MTDLAVRHDLAVRQDPQCQRCQKYGVECPGYPAKNVIFCDDTDRVRQRAVKKYEMKQRSLTQHSSASDSLNAILEPLQMGLSIETIPTPDLRSSRSTLIAGAVATFLHRWRIPDPDVFWGAFDSVPELYSLRRVVSELVLRLLRC
jgi:hypothetical protein